MKYLILTTERTASKGRKLLDALYTSAKPLGIDAIASKSYERCEVLVLYGLGGSDRLPIAEAHKKAGGRVVAFDLGYWDRMGYLGDRKFRVSIDDFHCHHLIFKGDDQGPQRRQVSGIECNPDQKQKSKNILLVGHGVKSIAVYANGWAAKKSRELRKAFPGYRIIYKPKPRNPVESGVLYDCVDTSEITATLKKISLVVCRHSNVAVDACRMGVPVVCEDGAAASIYPSQLSDYQNQPTHQQREEFLNRLAWWQWSINECREGQFWKWIEKII